MLDTVIRGGTIIDGTGSPGYLGDVGIAGGKIVAVGGRLSDAAREVIDADGAIVTPGFIDVHTHYDGQFLWDDRLDPSVSNGVTTAVAGNCGVGFAPVRPEYRRQLMEMMEGVEDIPEIVLDIGLDWNWRSFPDYLDRIAARRYTLDVAVSIPHAPLRVFVMGERALAHENATEDDIVEMARLTREAMAAGAIGFSAGRILEHRSSKGAMIPGTFSEKRELIEIARAMGARGKGIFQIVPFGTSGTVPALNSEPFDRDVAQGRREAEHALMVDIARASGRPLTYVLLQHADDPDDYWRMLAASEAAAAQGVDLRPQISARQIGIISTLDGYHGFRCRPSYLEIAHLPRGERAAAMREPDRRRAILTEDDVALADAPTPQVHFMAAMSRTDYAGSYPWQGMLDYEPDREQSIEAVAARTGKTGDEVQYDLLAEGDGDRVLLRFAFNYVAGNLDSTYTMIKNPRVVVGLADSGAHLSMACDGAMPTFTLGFWGRDRTRGPILPLELLIRRLSADGADLYGFADRGTLAVGKRADINVINFDKLGLKAPAMHFDLPEGGRRFGQETAGYLATMVNGVTTRRFDADTGARPGALVRAGA